MRSRWKHYLVVFVAIVVIAAVAIIAAFTWRLSQGPVSLAFLKQTVEERINASLPDTQVRIRGVVIERDGQTGQPRLRLREIQFMDKAGRLIARAPRAAIGVRAWDVVTGNIQARNLELIGASLLIQRAADGSLGLGFGELPGAAPADYRNENKIQPNQTGTEFLTAQANNLLQLLKAGPDANKPGAAAVLAALDTVRISKASITFYDQSNGAVWYSPGANLVYRRTQTGFALFVDAKISARTNPWRVEMTALYRKKTGKFRVSSRVFNLIPAELARDVFALSQFAQVRLPLSGHVEAEFDESGALLRAGAELTAAAGRVGFPEYISEPIIIDEGLVRLDFDPKTGDVNIAKTSIFVGGSQAQLTGKISPKRGKSGALEALAIKLESRNAAIDTAGTVKNPVTFDLVSFNGVASLRSARLIVNDLILMTGNSGIRVRGQFVGGGRTAGVFLAGTIRDMPAATIKRLWPPIVARGAREWITKNVISGKMTKGQFKVAIPAETIQAAINDQIIPDHMVDFRFDLAGVTTRYFGELPPLQQAAGKARMSGNNFHLELKSGGARVGKNQVVKLISAKMHSKDLAAKISPTSVAVTVAGSAPTIAAFVNHKPLELLKGSSFNPKNVSGQTQLTVNLDMPLSRRMHEDQVKLSATATWTKANFKNPLANAQVKNGSFKIIADKKKVVGRGRGTVNGLDANIEWFKPLTNKGADTARLTIRTTTTEEKRAELGFDLSRFVRGRVGLKVVAHLKDDKVKSADVEADLAKSILALDEIGWLHPAGKNTKARFKVAWGPKTQNITNLKITGGGINITGGLTLSNDGTLIKADFPKFRLSKTRDMALVVKAQKGRLFLVAKGRSFDARSLINQAFARQTGRKRDPGNKTSTPTTIEMNFTNVITNRGEIVKNVSGQVRTDKATIVHAELRGNFVGGAPATLQVVTNVKGGRNLVFVSRDAGAALRAANLYSKVVGGTLSLRAALTPGGRNTIDKGLLILRHFIVRDTATFQSIDVANKRSNGRTDRQAKTGPRRRIGQKFTLLKVPFSTDKRFVRIGDALVHGTELGASANGRIRKVDGAMDIGGTIIPAYALNSAIGEVPVLGQILTGGKGHGVFGMNYAISGTMRHPKILVNPVSAIAPGILRQLFSIGGGNVGADGTGIKKPRKREFLQ